MKSIFKLLLFFLFSSSIFGAEIDHYLFMYDNQRDASKALNKKFNSMLAKFIENKSDYKKGCDRLVSKVGKRFQKGTESKIGRWLRDTYKVDQRPRAINGKGPSYYNDSIYYNKRVPNIWPATILKKLAPVINVNSIYIGGDKIGHMTGVGLGMYNFYQDKRKAKKSEKKAERFALGYAFITENTILGRMGSKVFSFADMEANYQGYRMFRDLCEGPSPHIAKNAEGKWYLKKKVDLRKYINPYMNEVFNPSEYTKRRKKLVEKHMNEKYCNDKFFKTSHLIKRQRYYKSIAKPSVMQVYLDGQIEKGKLKDHNENHIINVCQRLRLSPE